MFAVFSLRRSIFWQVHGSSGSSSKAAVSISTDSSISFSKATDSISAALRVVENLIVIQVRDEQYRSLYKVLLESSCEQYYISMVIIQDEIS